MKQVENCYQCIHYQTCYLRISMERLLSEGHHSFTVGGKTVLRNSIPRPFLVELAGICRIKEQ